MIKDRQIKTGHNVKQIGMTLEAQKEVTIGGKKMKAGDTIEVTRSEARRLMVLDKTMFKVLLD